VRGALRNARRPAAQAAIALGALLVSCSGAETAVRLTVLYEDAWAIDELHVEAGGRTARVDAAHEVLVLVSDATAGEEIAIEVSGLRDGTRVAFGSVVVRPILGREVNATVALARLACGAWCTEGASACEGDGVVTCQRDGDGCMRWATPIACPSATPFCSLGVCNSTCVDECGAGEQRCAGPDGVQQCGQADSDPCRDWLTATACADGEQCESGRCASQCTGECEVDAVQCRDGGLSRCADRNFDGCMEWGPNEPCASGESCEGGACVPFASCTDGCTTNACTGMSLTRCGNYDLDPCLEPSPGTSCVPADLCMEGRCTLGGCESTPRVCMAPPASYCADASTLRVYDSSGTCTAGACDYTYRDQSCPSCPACDACAGVTCNSPPMATCLDAATLRTFMAPGSCSGGTCTYPHMDTPCACTAGSCGCTLDANEPNNTYVEVDSKPVLASIPNASWDGTYAMFGLHSASDVDWYRFDVTDMGTLNPEITVTLGNIPGGSDYELAAYYVCAAGGELTTCAVGSPDSGTIGEGCSSTNAGSVN
jgi:hypothetical protein